MKKPMKPPKESKSHEAMPWDKAQDKKEMSKGKSKSKMVEDKYGNLPIR